MSYLIRKVHDQALFWNGSSGEVCLCRAQRYSLNDMDKMELSNGWEWIIEHDICLHIETLSKTTSENKVKQ